MLNPYVSTGCGCGYVIIPQNHVLHGVDGYDVDVDVDVHGGITYSKLITNETLEIFPEISVADLGNWIIGFHTGNCDDNQVNCNENYVLNETISLYNQIKNYKNV